MRNRDRRTDKVTVNNNITVNCNHPTATVKFTGYTENGIERRVSAEVRSFTGEVKNIRLNNPKDCREQHLREARNVFENL